MPTFRHATCESILPKWQDHEFYTSSLVLGIDIGLEGIGVFLRRGPQTLYEKTLIYRIPQTNALGQRRQYRAARRCRKNRRTRLKRLEKLFRHHGLPWFEGDDDALTRSDPFLLRHRALTKKLASQEALSICIRHLVTHRGYEYFSDEGEYPWGDEASLSAAVKWVRTAFVDEETAQFLRTECRVIAELAGGKAEEKYQQFCEVLDERLVSAENNPISEVLRDYAAEKRNHIRQRARGYAFPRKLVWSHLEIICRRHADLIGDLEGFLHALGAPSSQKSESIFFYNRKTREEMEAHWAKKVGLCPYASELGLSAKLRRGLRAEMSIRRFSLLEFLASRRLQLADGTLRQVSDACVENLLNWMKAFEAAYQDQAPLPAQEQRLSERLDGHDRAGQGA